MLEQFEVADDLHFFEFSLCIYRRVVRLENLNNILLTSPLPTQQLPIRISIHRID